MAELTTLEFMETARRLLSTRTTDERERGLLDDFLTDLEREVTRVRGYPRNRFRVVVRVEADSWQLAARELLDVAMHVEEHGPTCTSVMGGANRSHLVDVSELPEITPARHAEDLLAWRTGGRAVDLSDPVNRFPWEGENGSAWSPPPEPCRACGAVLLPENRRTADGCPCNSPRGVNHGLVPENTCTCPICDPEQTGATRYG